uniref:Uncharacterized protein n=1 Tax=Acrobeloides nanus TaxID=290746 RepID=A0A914E082_9BILA
MTNENINPQSQDFGVPSDGIYKCSKCKQIKYQYRLPYRVPKTIVCDGIVASDPEATHFCLPSCPNYPGPLTCNACGETQ